jgi:hypothetical protein
LTGHILTLSEQRYTSDQLKNCKAPLQAKIRSKNSLILKLRKREYELTDKLEGFIALLKAPQMYKSYHKVIERSMPLSSRASINSSVEE